MTDTNRLAVLTDFARALAATSHLGEMSRIVTERGRACFGADAACTFVRRNDDRLEMLAESGCTERFKLEWRTIPLGVLGLAIDGATDDVFLGSANEFKANARGADELVDESHRQMIGYAPLRAGPTLIGVFGYSFDRVPTDRPDAAFARAFASVAGLALARFNVGATVGGSRLSIVRDQP